MDSLDWESLETEAKCRAEHIVSLLDSPFINNETLTNWIKNAILDMGVKVEIEVKKVHNDYYRKNIKPKLDRNNDGT